MEKEINTDWWGRTWEGASVLGNLREGLLIKGEIQTCSGNDKNSSGKGLCWRKNVLSEGENIILENIEMSMLENWKKFSTAGS